MTNYALTKHAIQQAEAKGIDHERIFQALRYGRQFPVTGHGDQTRFVHGGIAVIASDTGAIITVYLDRVATPLRPDQIERGEKIERRY